MANRFEASVQLFKEDLLHETDTGSAVNNIVSGVRNLPIALFRGIGNIVPSALNAFNGQQYDVVRRDGPFHGTSTAVQKVARTPGVLGRVSALAFESSDDILGDGTNILTGGAAHVIKPSTRANINNVMKAA